MFDKRANEWDVSTKSGIIVPFFKKGDRKCVLFHSTLVNYLYVLKQSECYKVEVCADILTSISLWQRYQKPMKGSRHEGLLRVRTLFFLAEIVLILKGVVFSQKVV